MPRMSNTQTMQRQMPAQSKTGFGGVRGGIGPSKPPMMQGSLGQGGYSSMGSKPAGPTQSMMGAMRGSVGLPQAMNAAGSNFGGSMLGAMGGFGMGGSKPMNMQQQMQPKSMNPLEQMRQQKQIQMAQGGAQRSLQQMMGQQPQMLTSAARINPQSGQFQQTGATYGQQPMQQGFEQGSQPGGLGPSWGNQQRMGGWRPPQIQPPTRTWQGGTPWLPPPPAPVNQEMNPNQGGWGTNPVQEQQKMSPVQQEQDIYNQEQQRRMPMMGGFGGRFGESMY